MFKGIITALLTPFIDGKVDEKGFQAFVERQISLGIHGVVPCGTTGESPTLSHAEHSRVIEACIEVVNGRVPVIAGAGSNSTTEAIMMAKHAKVVGADAILVATPYYNKPTQEGLYQHFKAIHDAVEIPMILYNIPGRSVIDMKDETTVRLAKLPNVIGIKDATGDITRLSSLRAMLGESFLYLSGDDASTLGFLAQGGHGCISVSSNLVPDRCVAMLDAWNAGDTIQALAIHESLMPLHRHLFVETSPGPVKYAASLMGFCHPELRLPMVEPSDPNKAIIRQALQDVGLLNAS